MDVTLRPAVVGDACGIESVRIATWKVAYRDLLPDALLDELSVEQDRVDRWAASIDADPSFVTVAETSDEIVGWAAVGPCRDEDLPGARELWGIYLLPACWSTGTGAALIEAAGPLDVVWVLEGNARAIGFYERRGLLPDGTRKVREGLGAELRYVLR